MFVVFEGIDGSGKTTVSNRVADELRARGIEVRHVREGGEFASPLVARMREFGKDPRNMSMLPMTELLMYTARDAQLLAECIEPALTDVGLVFADRYFYSYEVLGHSGRGLDLERITPVLEAAAGGIWPDLAILVDIKPHVARARRKIRKIAKKVQGVSGSGGSRKGLGGVGLQRRLRNGYLELAARNPRRWLVVDNTDADLEELVAALTDAVAMLYEGASPAKVIASTEIAQRTDARPPPSTLEEGRREFFEIIAERAAVEPEVAAYWLAGMDSSEAYDWRDRLADEAPDVIAYGLRGLGDTRAWRLRDRLVDVAPYYVARSLDGLEVEGPKAEKMRRRLVKDQPTAVLATLDGVDSDAAWKLRTRLAASHLPEVVSSTKRIDSHRAWDLRRRLLDDCPAGEPVSDMEVASAVGGSVRGLDSEEAWDVRARCLEAAPVAVIRSLAELTSEQAWEWRERLAARAPKVMLRTIDGLDSPPAWELRRHYAPTVKEALDSMIGLDAEEGWAIREALADVWPSTVVKSLGLLAQGDRGRELTRTILVANPGDVSLLKHIARHHAAGSQSSARRASRGTRGGAS